MSTPWKRLLTGSAVVAASTLVSPVFGFLRDLALAELAGNCAWPPLVWAILDLGILAGIFFQSPESPPAQATQGVSLGLVVG